MNRASVTIAVLGVAAAAALLAVQRFARAKEYSGPGVVGNLRHLQLAKEVWQLEHTNEWPTVEDLHGEAARGKAVNDFLRPRYGEIYIINRTGEPACVYFPKARGGFPAGALLCLQSNTLVPFSKPMTLP